MITGYFDESCTDEGQRVSVVSGILASYDVWDAFRIKWERVLEKHNLDSFHMSEFACGELKNKNKEKVGPENSLSIFEDLSKVAVDHTLWAFSVKAENEFISKLGLPKSYHLCSLGCCFAINKWAKEEAIQYPIGLVFDRGNKYRMNFESGYNEALKIGIIGPQLEGSVAFDSHKRVVPLQAADILAWLKGRDANRTLPQWSLGCFNQFNSLIVSDIPITEEFIRKTLSNHSHEEKRI